jgi:hypothetical protein
MTGLDVYGFAPFDDQLNYHFFVQGTEDLDDSYINIAIDQHVGASLEKHVTRQLSIGGGLGTFHRIDGTATDYVNASFRYQKGALRFQGEIMNNRSKLPSGITTNADSTYLQVEYQLSSQHAVITRGEYFRDERTGPREKIATLGYSYRPIYPVSLKLEYQWHSDSADNKVLASFSVLF